MILRLFFVSCTLLMHNVSLEAQPSANEPYRNASLGIEARVADLLQRMTLEEKAGQLNQLSGGVFTGPAANDPGQQAKMEMVRKGKVGSMLNVTGVAETRHLQQIAIAESRLGIPLLFAFDVIHGYKTIFPIPLAEACAWDPALSEKAAAIAAKEASAEGLHWTFAPMVDISRDARWGRVMEGAGEDPYLGSILGAARVKGFQGNWGKDNLMASVKHFGVYGAVEAGREYGHVQVDRYTAWNAYLPTYKAAVQAGAATVMNSFNVFEGVPASANTYLLQDVLHKQWGFRGLLVSDWDSFGEMIAHGYAADKKEVAMKALQAGSMIDMETRAMVEHIPTLVKEGKVSQAILDSAVAKVLWWKFRLGLFDDPFKNCDEARARTNVFTNAHRAAAREAGQKSIVLLKNENNLLPLPAKANIALIGKWARSAEDIFDFWVANAKTAPEYSPITLEQGLQQAGIPYQYAEGYAQDGSTTAQMIADAIAVARQSNIAVVNIGLSGQLAGEDRSLASPVVPAGQVALLKALKEAGKKVVAVVSAGRPLVLTEAAPYCDAIVYAWILGTEHGHALADVLLGKVNPSGKTVMSFPYAVGQIPVYYNHMRTSRPVPQPGMTDWYSRYRDIPNEPLYPFGFGLSYTNFSYGSPSVDKTTLRKGEAVTITVEVTNSGDIAGDEVVQLYIEDPVANRIRPVRELKGFEKINLKPGATQQVRFKLHYDMLTYLDETGQPQLEAGLINLYIGANSRDAQKITINMQ